MQGAIALSEINAEEIFKSDKSIVIACNSSHERRIFHQVAKDLKLDHVSIRTYKFPTVFLYKCPNCKEVCGVEKIKAVERDEVAEASGASEGRAEASGAGTFDRMFCRCAQGGSFATLKKFPSWNAVVVGKDLKFLKTSVNRSKGYVKSPSPHGDSVERIDLPKIDPLAFVIDPTNIRFLFEKPLEHKPKSSSFDKYCRPNGRPCINM